MRRIVWTNSWAATCKIGSLVAASIKIVFGSEGIVTPSKFNCFRIEFSIKTIFLLKISPTLLASWAWSSGICKALKASSDISWCSLLASEDTKRLVSDVILPSPYLPSCFNGFDLFSIFFENNATSLSSIVCWTYPDTSSLIILKRAEGKNCSMERLKVGNPDLRSVEFSAGLICYRTMCRRFISDRPFRLKSDRQIPGWNNSIQCGDHFNYPHQG